ncbi:MAG: protein translocase subunit SecD [Acidimicrobiia bacterium]|nr:MAG: protein translocase subunit SecD [Acidimicrobiia bacterium]
MRTRRYVVQLVATVTVIVGTFVWTLLGDDRPVLGLDLQGGVSIVLFPVEGSDTAALDTAADIIRNRVDALGIAEPEVNRQGDTIVVDLPGVKDRARAEELVGQTAELRFRLVESQLPWTVPDTTTTATAAGSSTSVAPGTTAATVATSTTTAAPAATPGGDARSAPAPAGDAGRAAPAVDAVPIASARPAQSDTTPAPTPAPAGGTTATTAPAGSTTTTTSPAGAGCADLVVGRDGNVADASVWLAGRDGDGDGEPDGCYLVGPTLLTGRAIADARARYDETTAGWIVDVEFRNDDFATQVAQPNVGRQVAIDLDGVVQSAPVINEGITGRNVVIEGSFSEGEARDLALVLRYGALPVQFDPDEQTVQSVSPSLGRDQLRAGIAAGLIGLALVALYMVAYYRLLGLVVWIGLGLTGMVFFTITTWLSANRGLTLTLAGVTGLIVSVGVTVDSYVVYFERLKDEVRTGKTVRSSLDVGFRRSFRTIVAADLVSLLGAAVLYLLASGSVRGFAFFLGLSTAIDLVLAYFFMHPLVVLLARRPALVRMPGVGIAAGLDVRGVRA